MTLSNHAGDAVLIDDRDVDAAEDAAEQPWLPVLLHPYRAAVTVASMGLALWAILRSGGSGDSLGTVAWCTVSAIGVALAMIDAQVRRLPFVITAPLTAVTLTLVGWRCFSVGAGWRDLAWMFAATGIAFGVSALAAWFGKMGAGDVVLLTALAPALSVAAFIIEQRTGEKQYVPFGPILVISTVAAFVFHGAIQQLLAI
jgi:prepilin signal peptidase PulO-like enzyme (type II secretory pathway)